jgi:crotonobetainyl-CoA:carnitine CoA-transferase CaiB-like acyl-CoA transferase
MFHLLAGLKVVDLTTTYLGPYATRFLGDMGADIVKVEPPGGDVGRFPRPGRSPDMGAGFINTNRNKRSLCLDLKTGEGQGVVRRLVRGADVFVHNMRPSSAARLTLGYDELTKENPALVYCFSAGFGQDGPYADEPAYDDIIQAASGLAHLNAGPDGAPRFLPSILCDKYAGLSLGFAILAGVVQRLKTGKGAYIEVPMFESMVSFLMTEHLAGRSFVPPLGGAGYERLLSPNRKPYKTRDSFAAIMPYTTQHWLRFFKLIGRDDLAREDWTADPVTRSERVETLYALIAEVAPTRTTGEWLTALKEVDIPCGKVNTLADLFDDPHLVQSGFFAEMSHPSEGALLGTRPPFKVENGNPGPDLPAPRPGQHTRDILQEAGYSQEEAESLVSRGIAVAGPGRLSG